MLKKQWAMGMAFVLFVATFAYAFVRGPHLTQRQLSCKTSDFQGLIDTSSRIALFEGLQMQIPEIALSEVEPTAVLGQSNSTKWIDVDLSEQKLRAWEGDRLHLETLVSTGLPWWPTPKGEFHIWIKLRATKMEGGQGKYYYYLPNVPYVMFFGNTQVPNYLGYGLHGTYWHSDFGTQRSHGCVNLPTEIAEVLYHWTDPQLPDGKSVVYATEENPGTRIVIHD
jgi:lipoprotein-anchoring transpeptidase ErfK/SrfK